MHRRHAAVSALLSLVLLASIVPSAAAHVVRTDYSSFTFPAGWPNSGTTCPYTWIATPITTCAVSLGTMERVGQDRWVVRDLVTFAYQIVTSDPSLSGYQFATLNANLDATGNGPAQATWQSYLFTNEPTLTGTWTGKFEDGYLNAHFVGHGTGDYAGWHLTGDVLPYDTLVGNTIGEFKQTGQ